VHSDGDARETRSHSSTGTWSACKPGEGRAPEEGGSPRAFHIHRAFFSFGSISISPAGAQAVGYEGGEKTGRANGRTRRACDVVLVKEATRSGLLRHPSTSISSSSHAKCARPAPPNKETRLDRWPGAQGKVARAVNTMAVKRDGWIEWMSSR
jgi:hypothetical protein